MKTKVFEPGAICAAVALLVVLSLPAYAKNGGSSSAHTRVGKTSTNATSSKTTQSGTAQKPEKKVKGQAAATQALLPTGANGGKGQLGAAALSSAAGTINIKDKIIAKQNEDRAAEYRRKNSPPFPCVGRNC